MIKSAFKVNFKIYDVAAWLTNNCNTLLPNISRCKDNQAMKFVQLIDYAMRNIFLEKSYKKCGGETSPRPFSEKLKLSLSLESFIKFIFIVRQAEGYRIALKLSC